MKPRGRLFAFGGHLSYASATQQNINQLCTTNKPQVQTVNATCSFACEASLAKISQIDANVKLEKQRRRRRQANKTNPQTRNCSSTITFAPITNTADREPRQSRRDLDVFCGKFYLAFAILKSSNLDRLLTLLLLLWLLLLLLLQFEMEVRRKRKKERKEKKEQKNNGRPSAFETDGERANERARGNII